MLSTLIVGNFGESFIAHLFHSLGYTAVDVIDAKGIDLACYSADTSYGISVKCRNIQFTKNESINLTYNDIVYTYDESVQRKLTPAYAFLMADLQRIDVLIVTQEFTFSCLQKDAFTIDEYKNRYVDKQASKSTKSISTSLSAREKWKTLKGQPGVIFTASYVAS